MTKVGDNFIHFCDRLHTIPTAVLCVILVILQAACLDYYLVTTLSIYHLVWLVPDVFNLVLLICCIYVSYSVLGQQKSQEDNQYSFAWVSWLLNNVIVCAKMIVLFNEIAPALDENDPSFFGPNTLKTSIALGSAIFMLLLITQHDAPLGSERRHYIEELTGTVVFDVLDTVDILEVLFNGEVTEGFWVGLREYILAVATMNLLIPTIPLVALSRTKFGHKKLQKHLVYTHRLLVVLIVNMQNLLVRFIVWHGFSGAVSPFSLKNIILIGITFYEFYLHKKEKYAEHENERINSENRDDKQLEQKNYGFSVETSHQNNNFNQRYMNEGFMLESRIETSV